MRLFGKYINKQLLKKDLIKYRKYIVSVVIFLIGYIIASRIYHKIMEQINKKYAQNKMNIASDVFASFIYYIIILLGLFLALLNSDIDTNSIMVVLGSFGLAIALAMQNSVTRIINGFLIIYYGYYKIGDIIKVNDISGKVVEFTLFNTVILNRENNVNVIISNNDIVSNKIINYTKMPNIINNIRVSISANNQNLNYTNLLNKIKTEINNKSKYIIDKNKTTIDIDDMEKSGTTLNIKFYIESSNIFESQNEIKLLVRDILSSNNVKLLDNSYIV